MKFPIFRKPKKQPLMEHAKLKNHVFATYMNLRLGIGVLVLLFPFALYLFGWAQDIQLQSSMSAYYYQGGQFVSVRDLFVANLMIIGIFLFLYKGYSAGENIALNLAGISAILVAFIPMAGPGEPAPAFSLHGFFAVGLFVCVAYVCFFHASDTLKLLKNKEREEKLQSWYFGLGVAMLLAPLIAWFLTFVLQRPLVWTYITEAIGMIVFASYWILKGRELLETNAEMAALLQQLET